MKLFLIVAGFAAVIGLAVPARADSTDDAFVASLDKAGIKYGDADKAAGAGKWVCTTLQGGKQMSDVVSTLQSKNSNLSDDHANTFAAIAVNAYCPDQASSITPASTTDTPPSTS
ncbi:DUF732 domain-containing protein [Mycobacterium avium]|uniref:DUF732 domain-containing protein n=1 Tax=Mycobacterium avium TaxID=1764 RepID=UPI00041B46FE|nr:DUF732 domain-containing protein [Mycobacterium avium]APT11944.1 hypothetical protein BS641_18245 [Mycobacterium avium subsp. hominissuis]MCA2237480.1 DUF732 domain-containing protein [Mycobacterium avium]MCA2259824.1 DUF732 domain-containing protein [Mycobacterium avium]MCA2268500.1 DUF732 domain-containing protein [Mycobacterium avium]MCA2278971.1 DUF732 domain-containing protein [Mycobacterium avium]